jgi:SAM-dependent methyltransferase
MMSLSASAHTPPHQQLGADEPMNREDPQGLGEHTSVSTDAKERDAGDVADARQDTAETSEHAQVMPTVVDTDAGTSTSPQSDPDASSASASADLSNPSSREEPATASAGSSTPAVEDEEPAPDSTTASAEQPDAATEQLDSNQGPGAAAPAKIRWPDNLRRKPAQADGSASASATNGETTSDVPAHSNGAAKLTSSKPPPRAAWSSASSTSSAPVGRTPLPPAPTGEGIVRVSGRPPMGRVSEAPTRPHIPLTQDMALAAGRITSQDILTPYMPEELAATHPRIAAYPPPTSYSGAEHESPAVLVTRAKLISDRPPASDAVASRPSRRPRADSDDIETLDLDDSDATDEMLRLDDSTATSSPRPVADTGVRTARTPPPPPAQSTTTKRTSLTGQHTAVGVSGTPSSGPRPGPPPPPPGAATKKPTGQVPAKSRARKRAWWEVLFSDDYLRTLPRPSANAIAKQVNFMEASLGIKRGDSVLDVGCGLGQHALEFAKRGYLVVALDLALSMITRAAEEAQQRGLRINFLHKDIRDIGFEGTFDAIVCVGTTFGFFDDEQNRGVISRLAHALKPGGRLLLEVANRDFVIASQPNLVWFEGDNCVVMEESDFNFYSSRLTVKRTMMRDDGRQSDTEYNIRLYSVHELGQMLKHAGFSIKEVSGQEATRGMFFGAQSSRIIILAERRARGRKDSIGAPPSNHQG